MELIHHGFRILARDGKKPAMLQSVVDDTDSLRVEPEKLGNVRFCAAADGNDLILALREPAHHDAPINHAFPVILAGHSEWSQIVNSGDQRAGARPEQTAIARNMQHVNTMLPH